MFPLSLPLTLSLPSLAVLKQGSNEQDTATQHTQDTAALGEPDSGVLERDFMINPLRSDTVHLGGPVVSNEFNNEDQQGPRNGSARTAAGATFTSLGEWCKRRNVVAHALDEAQRLARAQERLVARLF